MSKEKTLRDEIAMSMTQETLPTISSTEVVKLVSEKYGLVWDEDPINQIEWAMHYSAAMRYLYADAMLAAR